MNGERIGNLTPAFDEPKALDFFNSSVEVSSFESENGLVKYVADIQHPPLSGSGLFELLTEVAPTKDTGPLPVIFDWRMPDNEKEYRQLGPMHEKLGLAWETFMGSRRYFLNNLEFNIAPSVVFSAFHPEKFFIKADTITGKDVISEALKTEGISGAVVEELLKEAGVANPQFSIFPVMQAVVYRRNPPGRNIKNQSHVKKRFNTFPKSRIAIELPKVADHMSDEQREELLAIGKPRYFMPFTGDDGEEYVFAKTLLRSNDEIEKLITIKEKGNFKARILEIPHRRLAGYERHLVPGSFQQINNSGLKLCPRIEWEKLPDGERRFVFSDAQEFDGKTIDSVLGALVLSYFAKDLRGSWPKKLRIGRSREQTMGQAQVPVLVLFPAIQRALLESDFIINAEKIAEPQQLKAT